MLPISFEMVDSFLTEFVQENPITLLTFFTPDPVMIFEWEDCIDELKKDLHKKGALLNPYGRLPDLFVANVLTYLFSTNQQYKKLLEPLKKN